MTMLPLRVTDLAVAIGTKQNNSIDWHGTGFFYKYRKDNPKNKPNIYFVTNKHVIDGYSQVYLKINNRDSGSAIHYPLNLYDNDGNELFINHPLKDIDISIISTDKFEIESDIVFFDSINDAFTIEDIKSRNVSAGDFIYTIGYPMAIDLENKGAIVRSGCIARIDEVINYENDEFLLDTFVFPGNSGSPVLLKPEISAVRGTNPITKTHLIGIVKEYITFKDSAYSKRTGEERVMFTENAGLASAHPVDFINQTIEVYLKGKK